MKNEMLRPKFDIYEEDYECTLRTPNNEWDSGLHYHDFYECVIYLGKAGVFKINDEDYLVERGDIVLIDIFTPHTLINNTKNYYERFSIDIDPALLISYSTSKSNLLDVFHRTSASHSPVYHIGEDRFQKYIQLMNDYRNIKMEKGREILEKALVHQILAYVYNDCFIMKTIDSRETQIVATIARVINYINANLKDDLPLRTLAAEVNYSEYYICRLFKKMTGKTLVNYIQEKRIGKVASLIVSGVPVGKAAENVGFNNYSYFYRLFKRIKGCSPQEYKERLAQTDTLGA